MRYKERFTAIFAWLLTGVVLALSCSVMHMTGGNINKFYASGAVYDIFGSQIAFSSANASWIYQKEGYIELAGEDAIGQIHVKADLNKYNYIYIELSKLNRTEILWKVGLYDIYGNLIGELEESGLQEGPNYIPLGEISETAAGIKISAPEQTGAQFTVENFQLREKKLELDGKTIFLYTAIVFTGYLLVTGLFWIFCLRKYFQRWKKNVSGHLEAIGQGYVCLSEAIYGFSGKISASRKSAMRTILFLMMLTYPVYNVLTDQVFEHWKYNQIVCGVSLLFITVISVEKGAVRQKWKSPAAYSWIVFWLFVCLSDVLVQKRFSGAGWIQLTIFSFFFFVMGNAEKKDQIIADLIRAVRILMWAGILISVVFVPAEDVRYSGLFVNVNVFGNFLAVGVLSSASELTQKLHGEKSIRKSLLPLAEILVFSIFIWSTQCRAAVGAAAICAVSVIWFLWKKSKKEFTCLLLLTAALSVPVYKGVEWAIYSMPRYEMKQDEMVSQKLLQQEPVDIAEQIFFEHQAADNVVNAGQKDENAVSRIIDSFLGSNLDIIFSGRISYWKAYLRQMNLFGHEWRGTVAEKNKGAHNGLIYIAFTYGVVTVIPYIIMLVCAFFSSFCNMLKDGKYGMLPFLSCISFLIISSLGTEEQPYIYTIWFLMYLTVGFQFAGGRQGEHEG